ncbi:VOC family protein [Desulforamulus ruminis]|uniref:Glyoxalase/bleomycin resistance protein/dioxygenase n=1 Tax=Desulforamulus ruminis (strain ATCC 23193 / DSM 2154 / NCIMB 8452 / DL) TaxID=696281 RepID=F6DQM9_DESRL|nr:VOC family protein [Desulforamulus ruminis]AEG62026.1 Glyoxalase/bleomycin resistance protein/dioxygenase [Desulforamulus ruminis DSM 2154]
MELEHIGLRVKDVQRSFRFYKQIFGCELIESYQDERVEIIFAQCGKNVLELIRDKGGMSGRAAGVIDHLAFRVERLEDWMDKLAELQVPFISEQPRDFKGGRIFFFKGPDGEILELVEEPPQK